MNAPRLATAAAVGVVALGVADGAGLELPFVDMEWIVVALLAGGLVGVGAGYRLLHGVDGRPARLADDGEPIDTAGHA